MAMVDGREFVDTITRNFSGPGSSFGPLPQHVRMCFAAALPDEIRRGIEILAAKLRGQNLSSRPKRRDPAP